MPDGQYEELYAFFDQYNLRDALLESSWHWKIDSHTGFFYQHHPESIEVEHVTRILERLRSKNTAESTKEMNEIIQKLIMLREFFEGKRFSLERKDALNGITIILSMYRPATSLLLPSLKKYTGNSPKEMIDTLIYNFQVIHDTYIKITIPSEEKKEERASILTQIVQTVASQEELLQEVIRKSQSSRRSLSRSQNLIRIYKHLLVSIGSYGNLLLIERMILSLKIERELMKHSEFRLSTIPPLKLRPQKTPFPQNIFTIPDLQFRFTAKEDLLQGLYNGIKGNDTLNPEDYLNGNSMFNVLKNWLIKRKEQQIHMGEKGDHRSHRANVNYPSGPLRVFRDYITKSHTVEIFHRDSEQREEHFRVCMGLSFTILKRIGRFPPELIDQISQELCGQKVRSLEIKDTYYLYGPGSFNILRSSAQFSEPKPGPIYDQILAHLDEDMATFNKMFINENPRDSNANFSLVISSKNIQLSSEVDYPFQGTIAASRVHPREILGILFNRGGYWREEKYQREYEEERNLFNKSPLLLVLTSPFLYGFLPALMKAGAPGPILAKLHIIYAEYFGNHLAGRDISSMLATLSEEFSSDTIEKLNKAAIEYLTNFRIFYDAEDYSTGLIRFITQAGYPIWDRHTGELLARPSL